MNYLAGQAEVNRQNGSAVAGEILEAWLAGTGLAELADPAAKYRAVTADEVQRVAAAYLAAHRRAEGVVRGTGAARSSGRRPAGLTLPLRYGAERPRLITRR